MGFLYTSQAGEDGQETMDSWKTVTVRVLLSEARMTNHSGEHDWLAITAIIGEDPHSHIPVDDRMTVV